MRILICGGDGYLGWPTAMHLSRMGHSVGVVDNYLRRRLAKEENITSLFNVPSLHERTNLWRRVSGYAINVYIGDLRKWDFVSKVFQSFHPEAVVHYAEQPSAPYSMLNRRAAMLTIQNNIETTANLIFAIKEWCPETHMVKLGTMGEYGTPNIDIEEGWIEIQHKGREDRFLFPRQASSLYHTTKIMDTDLLWFYVRTWNLKVTDLMQGPVYGFITEENIQDPNLFPFFNYDEIFGTVVNRFIAQAAAGYPLTIYGKGGQTRGYINIIDTLQCIRLALENPADKGELRIYNQFTECFSVVELADKIKKAGEALGLKVSIQEVKNPRVEKEEHYYNPVHTGLKKLGLKPHLMSEERLTEMLEIVLRYKNRIRPENFLRNISWK